MSSYGSRTPSAPLGLEVGRNKIPNKITPWGVRQMTMIGNELAERYVWE